jgi:hypothetical protein
MFQPRQNTSTDCSAEYNHVDAMIGYSIILPTRLIRRTTVWLLLFAVAPVLHAQIEKLELPPRPTAAPTGSQFLKQIGSLAREGREAATLDQITRGNIPVFLRNLRAIHLEATDSQNRKHRATFFVTLDYLAVGTDEDFFRIPMTPMTAQAIANATNTSLITAKLSDEIFRHAELKLEPKPLTNDRDATATFYHHHQIIEDQRREKPLGLLIAGIKKDVVLTNRLKEKPNRVAIYGWHYPSGKPIQPLYVGHTHWHVDYSHGIRLMSQHMIVDGQPMQVRDVLKHNDLCGLLSNEGPIVAAYE